MCSPFNVTYLIDLIIQNTNGAPEGRVPSIPIDSLLISFVGLVVVLLGHVTSSKKIPRLCVVAV
jgi:hypothetical protein